MPARHVTAAAASHQSEQQSHDLVGLIDDVEDVRGGGGGRLVVSMVMDL